MNRSLQANVTVFHAKNSIRRNIADYSLNWLSAASEFRSIEKTLEENESFTLANSEPIVAFVLGATKPVTLVITPRTGDPFSMPVNKFVFLTFDFESVEITAADDTALRIQVA